MTTPTYRSPTLTQVDSRRVPGPNLWVDRPGAILDVAGPPEQVIAVAARWREHVRHLLDAVGWQREEIALREFPGGANLVITAPLDALYAATEVNEAAFALARAEVGGGGDFTAASSELATVTASEMARSAQGGATNSGSPPDVAATVVLLRAKIASERQPKLIALRDACERHRVPFVPDDETVSIGIGRGSLTFDAKELPAPDAIDWPCVFGVPVAMVTGTNGKTTTVRLLAAMVTAAGLVPGVSSTDWVKVGDTTLDSGDYAGPAGARLVLRDRRVDIALLETARGGMMRRGLVLRDVNAAAITNVTEDHIGEWGVSSLADLLAAKLVIRRAVQARGRLVLNAEDPLLAEAGRSLPQPLAWFARDGDHPLVSGRARGGDFAVVEAGEIVLWRDGRRESIARVEAVPIALGGAARHNLSNALTAVLVASRLDLPVAAIAAGLCTFSGGADVNPGRGNVIELGGVRAIVDFAHNPDGIRAVMELAQALPAKRRLVIIGQAGDRDDAAILGLARMTARFSPDAVVIKEMTKYLRGREPGVIPAMLERELLVNGMGAEQVTHAPSELAAVEQAFAWAREGDLLLLLTHAERGKVLAKLDAMKTGGWKPTN